MTETKRRRRVLVTILLALALLIGLVSMFALWVDRQTLNPENGTQVSSNLLADEEIRNAVGAFMVDELFASIDVRAQIEQALPPEGAALATPAAAGLRELADRAAPRLLERPRVQAAWERANLVARTALVRFVESDNDDAVVLNLNQLITQLAGDLGLSVTIPPDAGRLEIVKANQIGTARSIANGIQNLALWGTVVMFALFALAVYLAAGWRRVALRRVGWCLVALGLLVILVRRVVGNRLIDDLVPTESVQSAAAQAWLIVTDTLYDIAVAATAYGVVLVIAAWLAGSTAPAVATRRALAPALRYQPGTVYAAVGFLYLLVLLWGPTPATRAWWGIIPIALLLILGIELLRREVAREFPDAQPGDTATRVRARIAAMRHAPASGDGDGDGLAPAGAAKSD
jgi:hypothetical protein